MPPFFFLSIYYLIYYFLSSIFLSFFENIYKKKNLRGSTITAPEEKEGTYPIIYRICILIDTSAKHQAQLQPQNKQSTSIVSPPYHNFNPNFVITKIATITIPQNQTCLNFLHLQIEDFYEYYQLHQGKIANYLLVVLVFLLLFPANL